MATIHYGTSSWSTPGWVGPFYPPGTRPGGFLEHYASQFGVVEADTTYYHVPRPELVDGWRRKTPPGFRLAAKFPRSIVHGGEGPRPDPEVLLVPERVGEETTRFLSMMDLLGDRCGPLVLQFPYFNRGAFASAAPFLERLDAFLGGLPDRFRYAVEVRNRQWLTPALTDLLRRHRSALVLVDLPYMPHPARLAGELDVVTTDFVYGRLIGDRKAVDARTKRFDAVVLDMGDRLARWAGLVETLRARVDTIFLFANNHYAGHGPATIRQLAERIEQGSPGHGAAGDGQGGAGGDTQG